MKVQRTNDNSELETWWLLTEDSICLPDWWHWDTVTGGQWNCFSAGSDAFLGL